VCARVCEELWGGAREMRLSAYHVPLECARCTPYRMCSLYEMECVLYTKCGGPRHSRMCSLVPCQVPLGSSSEHCRVVTIWHEARDSDYR